MSSLFLTAALAAASPMTSASTTATVGAWTLAGLDGSARHGHGGPAAQLGTATFRVTNAGPGTGTLTVTRVEFLTGRSCKTPPADVRSTPSPAGLFPLHGSQENSAPTLAIEPGTVEVTVGFPAVEAYYSWCDRFAFRVTFDAGGRPLVVVAETIVMRLEPLWEP